MRAVGATGLEWRSSLIPHVWLVDVTGLGFEYGVQPRHCGDDIPGDVLSGESAIGVDLRRLSVL
jgi:hypothetical protein